MAAIGKPFPGMDYMIASPSGKQLPAGETGELWIAGPQLMCGYWRTPEKAAGCFVTTPFGKLYYRTGDLCQVDADGDIIYCGRKDTQVKIQGFRIELGEIEYHVKAFYKHGCNAVVLPVYATDGSCELHLAVEKEAGGYGKPRTVYAKPSAALYVAPAHPLHSLFPTKQQQQN